MQTTNMHYKSSPMALTSASSSHPHNTNTKHTNYSQATKFNYPYICYQYSPTTTTQCPETQKLRGPASIVDGSSLPNSKPPAATALKPVPFAHRVCTSSVSGTGLWRGSLDQRTSSRGECRGHPWVGEGRHLGAPHLEGPRLEDRLLEDHHLGDHHLEDLGGSRGG
jgi:hypothetical protein